MEPPFSAIRSGGVRNVFRNHASCMVSKRVGFADTQKPPSGIFPGGGSCAQENRRRYFIGKTHENK